MNGSSSANETPPPAGRRSPVAVAMAAARDVNESMKKLEQNTTTAVMHS